MQKSVLIVAANPATHPTLHYPVGFWASEVFHPVHVFESAGISWQLASPSGGMVIMDPMSDPNDASGYSKWDELSKRYVDDTNYTDLLENTAAIDSLDLDQFDAIMVAGGQSPMFTFEKAISLQEAFSYFYLKNRVSAALCHGVALLNFIELDGQPLVKGKHVTGFTNAEEDQANAAVGQVVMPWRIEDALTDKGALFQTKEPWTPFALNDGHLVTGQQNMSGEVTAKKIVELLTN